MGALGRACIAQVKVREAISAPCERLFGTRLASAFGDFSSTALYDLAQLDAIAPTVPVVAGRGRAHAGPCCRLAEMDEEFTHRGGGGYGSDDDAYRAAGRVPQDKDSARHDKSGADTRRKMNGRFPVGERQHCAKSIDCNGSIVRIPAAAATGSLQSRPVLQHSGPPPRATPRYRS